MSLSHRYKNFSPQTPQDLHGATGSIEKVEEQKLQSFEDGYKSGWDDALAAQKTMRSDITAEFGRNLQEASFSYHEARTALARELRSVMEPILCDLLPKVAQETLAAHVIDEISALTQQTLDRQIEVAVHPGRLQSMESVCSDELSQPFTIVEDDTLLEDQVFLRVGASEREVNFEEWIQLTIDTVGRFFDAAEKEKLNV
jgi:flagellar assembly protein FliH